MKELTLKDGRNMTNLETHFDNQEIKLRWGPRLGKWFKVNPLAIERKMFDTIRIDQKQENTRQIILEAFKELDANPEKYAKQFETLITRNKLLNNSVEDFKKLAIKFDGHMADWVEQALEWAQRITNGETWETLCNKPDTTKWYRLIVWKNGFARTVGGCYEDYNDFSATEIGNYDYNCKESVGNTVPLIVSYK